MHTLNMRSCRLAAGLLLAWTGTALAPAAQAQDNPPRITPETRAIAQAAARACRADFARFCQGTQPGQGRVLACLREHQSELSEGCRKQIDQH